MVATAPPLVRGVWELMSGAGVCGRWTLREVLRRKAQQGVQVYVMMYKVWWHLPAFHLRLSCALTVISPSRKLS